MQAQSTPPNTCGVKICLSVFRSRELWLLLSQLVRDLEIRTTVFAVLRIDSMIYAGAYRTVPCQRLRGSARSQSLPQFTGYDGRRHSQNRITDQNTNRGDKPAHRRSRDDIPIADRCYCDDGPVNTHRNADKAVLRSVNHVEQAAEDNDRHHHNREEHHDRSCRSPHKSDDLDVFFVQLEEMQDAEDP